MKRHFDLAIIYDDDNNKIHDKYRIERELILDEDDFNKCIY